FQCLSFALGQLEFVRVENDDGYPRDHRPIGRVRWRSLGRILILQCAIVHARLPFPREMWVVQDNVRQDTCVILVTVWWIVAVDQGWVQRKLRAHDLEVLRLELRMVGIIQSVVYSEGLRARRVRCRDILLGKDFIGTCAQTWLVVGEKLHFIFAKQWWDG